MIHYNQLQKKFAALRPGAPPIKLRVDKMLSPGRYPRGHENEGEPKPPMVENGTLVEVVKVGVDSVEVKAPNAKKNITFSHARGADKLEEVGANEQPELVQPPLTATGLNPGRQAIEKALGTLEADDLVVVVEQLHNGKTATIGTVSFKAVQQIQQIPEDAPVESIIKTISQACELTR